MMKKLICIVLLSLLTLAEGCKKLEGGSSSPVGIGLAFDHSMELEHADQFSVDFYEGGYANINIADGSSFLAVPENAPVPEGLSADTTVLQLPLENIYLVATSAMDLFRAADGLSNIRFSGTDASGWYIDEAKEAIEKGEILYAGKYNAPDYELIYAEGCELAVESTMIFHNPEVKEELEKLGIPVLVERSSYEEDPLGRMEWIKLYGVLLGKEDEAEEAYENETRRLSEALAKDNTGKTVAFFAVNTNGSVTVRKSGDYVSRMIEMAGGTYIFDDLGGNENALSTVNMQLEDFYAGAKEADFLIYNSTIEGELDTLDELIFKCPPIQDFKAVQEGHVWCTGKNLFQQTMELCDMILDIHKILIAEESCTPDTVYLHHLS